jgi:purine-binding chemotaxis protein CheW
MPDKQETKKSYTERQLVIFKIGNEAFGVDINQVREIIRIEEITGIPNTETYIDGVINLRGKIIVVLDLAKKLNLGKREKTKDTRIIVIEVDKNTIGMVVDNCNEVLHLSGDQIEPAPQIIKSKIDSEYLEGVGILKDRLIILLNLTKVLGDKEIENIREAQIHS